MAKPLLIAFRVDASHQIGSGHLMRCLTLGDLLRQNGYNVLFICRSLPEATLDQVVQLGFPIKELPPPGPDDRSAPNAGMMHGDFLSVEQTVDADQTIAILAAHECNLLVIDHYGLDKDWEIRVATSAKVHLVVIDDLADRLHTCSLLVDQNLYPKLEIRYQSLVPANTICRLGPEFSLIRPQFAEHRISAGSSINTPIRILIMFGGSDPSGYGIKAAMAALDNDDAVVTLIGRYDHPSHVETINALAKRHQNRLIFAGYTYSPWINMQNSHIFIGAGGSSTWERCAVGLPGIIYAISDNQIEMSAHLGSLGYQVYMGHINEFNKSTLAAEIRRLRCPMVRSEYTRKCHQLVDGRGPTRILDDIERLCQRPLMQ